MLVLAMEFSRDATTRAGDRDHRATERRSGAFQAGERPDRPKGLAGVATEGRNRPGLLVEQDPKVTPSKRNSDARSHPQGPRASRTGPPEGCGPPGAGCR